MSGDYEDVATARRRDVKSREINCCWERGSKEGCRERTDGGNDDHQKGVSASRVGGMTGEYEGPVWSGETWAENKEKRRRSMTAQDVNRHDGDAGGIGIR